MNDTPREGGTRPLVRPEEILVAVPTLNEAAHIEACLESLIGTSTAMRQVRIVVADGGSTDDTVARVRAMARDFPNIVVIANPKRLQSAAINAVVAEMAEPGHRYLVRCDAHSTYPPGYVRAVVDSLASHPEAASVATPMDAVGDLPFQQAAAWIVDTPLGSGGSAHRGGTKSMWVDHGHHAGFRIDWFRRIGGYDESFSHNEDAEYDYRLTQAGGNIWLDTRIRLDYVMRPTRLALTLQYWRYGRGRARTVIKHRMRPRLRQLIPPLNLIGMVICLVLAPVAPILLLWPLLYLVALGVVSLTSAQSLESADGLWAGPALAIMHNAWGAGFLYQLWRQTRP